MNKANPRLDLAMRTSCLCGLLLMLTPCGPPPATQGEAHRELVVLREAHREWVEPPWPADGSRTSEPRQPREPRTEPPEQVAVEPAPREPTPREPAPQEPMGQDRPAPPEAAACLRDPNHGAPCQAGQGSCLSQGKMACDSKGTGLICSAKADDTQKSPEKCDGIDNDCDGKVDEDTCDDKDPCNGIESCDSKARRCVTPARPLCPEAPPDGACGKQSGGDQAPVRGRLTTIPKAHRFRLYDRSLWSQQAQRIAQIQQHPSVSAAPLSAVIGDLNRSATAVSSVRYVPCFKRGFRWNSGDTSVAYWWPQGISGTATAYATGTYKGRKLLLVSWYHKPDQDSSTSTNKGARLSLVDITSTSSIKYRLLLLVEPYLHKGKADFRPVPIHAGGIAWVGNLLYVADTSKGLRVFDLDRILQVSTGDKDAIGFSSSKNAYHGFNYKYVVPQVNSYSLCWSCCARFSFVAVDPTTTPPRLVTGSYTATQYNARLHTWPLDGNKLKTQGGIATASQVLFPGVRRIQGAVSIQGRFWISSSQPKSSSPASPGSLYTATPGGTISTYTFPYPPEDLHYSKFSKWLWSHNEKPNNRYVFAFDVLKVRSQCK